MTSARGGFGGLARGALFGAAATVACAGGPGFDTVTSLPESDPHPPGVSVDPASELPESVAEAPVASAVVVLRAPTDPSLARAVIGDFFKALVDESPGALDAVLAPQAVVLSRSRREPAREHFLGRFARYDYNVLRGERLYRDVDLSLSAPEATQSEGTEPHAAALERRLAHLRTSVAWGSRPRLFGDEIVFTLVARGGSWAITEIVEDF